MPIPSEVQAEVKKERYYSGYNLYHAHLDFDQGVRWALWELAHAALNEDPNEGKLTVNQIADMIIEEFPGVYNRKSTISTLRNNISLSPDFVAYSKIGARSVWELAGSTYGVPRDDKKAARAKATKKRLQVKAREQAHAAASKRGRSAVKASAKKSSGKKSSTTKRKASVTPPPAPQQIFIPNYSIASSSSTSSFAPSPPHSDHSSTSIFHSVHHSDVAPIARSTRGAAPVPFLNIMGSPTRPMFIPTPEATYTHHAGNVFPTFLGQDSVATSTYHPRNGF